MKRCRKDLAEALVGPFGHMAGKVLVGREAIPPSAYSLDRLVEAEALDSVLTCYGVRFGQADRRAVASLWSQYLFAALAIPYAAAEILCGRRLSLSPEDVSLDLEMALPSSLYLSGSDRSRDTLEGLESFVRRQIEPLVAGLARSSGASPRLFWSNAAITLAWSIREAAAMAEFPLDIPAADHRLFCAPTWPDGAPNGLGGALRLSAPGQQDLQRRICCVRYVLPGIPGCAETCPLGR